VDCNKSERNINYPKFPQSPETLSEWRVISRNQELH